MKYKSGDNKKHLKHKEAFNELLINEQYKYTNIIKKLISTI